MKAVVLDGAGRDDGDLAPIGAALSDELVKTGWDVETLALREMQIAFCKGCFHCWVRTPGICDIADAGRDVTKAIIQSDLMVFFTPVTFGGYSSELKKALDRSISIISPFFAKINGEVHHKPRYRRYPRLLGLGVLRQPDTESEQIFATLVGRNALNFNSPAYAAGVAIVSEGVERTRERIGTLLAAVGARS